MYDFGTFLVEWVRSYQDLFSRVGDRVSPWQSGQRDGQQRITYQQISGGNVRSLGGPSGLARERYQVCCIAPTQQEAKQLAQLVKGRKGNIRLDGYRGTKGGITVQACLLEDEREEPFAPAFGEARPNDRCVILDFICYWQEI